MVRNWLAVVAAICCAVSSSAAIAQTPELTVVARTPKDLQQVLTSIGQRGESFGLTEPAAFLTSYEQHLDTTKPLTAACVFSTQVPAFVAEFTTLEPTQFWSAIAEDGLTLNASTGKLSNSNGSLEFFVEQIGNKVRISDNADTLKNVRLPVAPTFNGAANESAVVAHVDWRNIRPEVRTSFGTQVLGVLLPQSQSTGADVSLVNLPELLSLAASHRIASWLTRSESLDLRFQIDAQNRVQLVVDVVNRTLSGVRPVQSPFTEIQTDGAIAQGQWNLPIEFEFRNLIQAWAAPLGGDVKGLFRGDQIEGTQGRDVLQEGARALARHALELTSLQNFQGSFAATERDGRPVLAAGLRIANPLKFDADLQKFLKAASDDGAPLKLQLNQPTSFDAQLHRIELPIAPELNDVRELLGEAAIVHVATTQHVVLIGVGEGSDELLTTLVAPGSTTASNLLSASVASGSSLGAKLGLAPVAISVTPIAQGFRLFATLPESKQQDGRLIGTGN